MKKVLITGITGQDGSYLAELLIKKGYEVHGIIRRSSSLNTSRINHLYKDLHQKNVKLILHYGDLADAENIRKIIYSVKPSEIYNMGAQSHVRVSFDIPEYTANITALGTLRILEAIRDFEKEFKKKIKFYQASSSEMFGATLPPQNENTCFHPCSPYGCSKVFAFNITKLYREAYGIFAVNGILFNHESPLRGLEFVTRKISNEVAKISLGLSKKLELGNILAKRDWGYAPEYVEGIWKSLQIKNPDDYILATNESHSVKEFVEKACQIADVSTKCLKITKSNLRPFDVDHLKGDYSKAKRKLGWKPKTKFNDLVKIMVEEDIHRWEQRLKGEYLPWDAGNS